MTTQLALRVAVVGTFSLAIFAILFFRLWFLQVLSADQYRLQANVNYVRNVEIAAPRGDIIDRNGTILASSQRAYAVEVSPPGLPVPLTDAGLAHPPRADAALYDRLAGVLGISSNRVSCPVNGHGVLHISQIACSVAQEYVQLPYANATVATDIPSAVLYYLSERQGAFPGVSVQQIYQRTYPLGDVASQVLGIVGRITKGEVAEKRNRGVSPNDSVGQSGLEEAYDQYLRGVDGADRVRVDALGNFQGYLSQKAPVAGSTLRTSLDASLEAVGQSALQQSIDTNYPANGGAFVAMNPENGAIYAMGSLPTYNASVFTKPVPESVYSQDFGPASNDPLLNRAIQSVGPTGSTFKPITATAALESGAWSVDESYDDSGQFCIEGQCRHNAGGAANGVLDLVNAIRVSDDVFFYNLGALLNADPIAHPNGGALQQWARAYGIGRRSGVDLPGESAGNLPTPAWRARVDRLELECEQKQHVPSCGIADGRPWSIGDNINLAVGQGDVQVTPVQLATAYAAIANGGSIVRPHIGADIESPDGTVLQKIDPPAARHLNINPLYLDTIRAGLHDAAQTAGGTSDDVFGNFPEQVYGKTGTAQYNGQQDYAWYVCFVPSWVTSKPIIVAVWVEQGGFGAVGAAPVAREILSQWFFGKHGAYVPGSSQTL